MKLKKKTRKQIDISSSILLIIGGLVHGGLAFGYNVVEKMLTPLASWLPEVIYGIVGLSAIWAITRNSKFMS
jgi:uncharacterized membrane protein YuzA (DUF378 family)